MSRVFIHREDTIGLVLALLAIYQQRTGELGPRQEAPKSGWPALQALWSTSFPEPAVDYARTKVNDEMTRAIREGLLSPGDDSVVRCLLSEWDQMPADMQALIYRSFELVRGDLQARAVTRQALYGAELKGLTDLFESAALQPVQDAPTAR